MKRKNEQIPSLADLRRIIGMAHPLILSYVDDYEKFLYLIKRYPKLKAVPTKNIDLVWHFHVSIEAIYINDCQRLFGYIVKHQRAANAIAIKKLKTRFLLTRILWSQLYQEKIWRMNEMAVCGVDGDDGDYGSDD